MPSSDDTDVHAHAPGRHEKDSRSSGRRREHRDRERRSSRRHDEENARRQRRGGSDEHRKRERSHRDDRSEDSSSADASDEEDKRYERSRKRRKSSHRREDDGDDRKSSSRRRDKKKSERKRKDEKKKKSKKEKKDKRKSANRGHKPDKKFMIHMGKPLGRAPNRLLDPEKDYFSFHQHLWVYLHREEGLAFNDMTSEETHDAFGRFADRYNKGDLESDYYDPKGLPSAALEEAKTTRHAWGFQTSELEERNLQSVEAGVRKQTEANAASNRRGGESMQSFAKSPSGTNEAQRTASDSTRQPDWAADRAASRRLREHVRTAEEEFGGGRKDGRERQLEKKKELSAKIHGASRDREGAGLELSDDAIYGGGGAEMDFKAAMARSKNRALEKRNKQEARVAELEAKEKGKQQEMLNMLGLTDIKPGQKITIAPRQDAGS